MAGASVSDFSFGISTIDKSTSTSDYYEIYAYQNNDQDSTTNTVSANQTVFGGFKIIT